MTEANKASKGIFNYNRDTDEVRERIKKFIEDTHVSMSIPCQPQIHLGNVSINL